MLQSLDIIYDNRKMNAIAMHFVSIAADLSFIGSKISIALLALGHQALEVARSLAASDQKTSCKADG